MTREERFMTEALALAKEAAAAGEVPVGCVIVRGEEIVGRGRNHREEKQSTASHAEMEAIAQANARLGTWRLDECELFVTLEPCPMCAGAITNARIKRLVIGARDPRAGAYGSVFNINDLPLNHKTELTCGVLEEECAGVLKDFFRDLRKSGK